MYCGVSIYNRIRRWWYSSNWWWSENGNNRGSAVVPFTGVPGPNHPPQSPQLVPADYARLFINGKLVDLLVVQNYLLSWQWIQHNQTYLNRPHSCVHQWIRQGILQWGNVCFSLDLHQQGPHKKINHSVLMEHNEGKLENMWFPEHFTGDRFVSCWNHSLCWQLKTTSWGLS